MSIQKTTLSSGITGLHCPIAAVASVLILSLLCGCLARVTRPGGIRPSYLPVRSNDYDVQGEVSGESSSFNLLGFLPVTPDIRFDEAMREAIGSKGGDNLIDVRWEWERHYWLVGTVTVLTVRGKVIIYREN